MRWVTKKRGNHGPVLLKEKLALNYRDVFYKVYFDPLSRVA